MKYVNNNQQYSSANTSSNKNKLPAIFHKLDWVKLKKDFTKDTYLKVLDYGAGKYTNHIRKYLENYQIEYYPFDPYNCNDKENDKAVSIRPDVIVCSNVLNVIAEDRIVFDIHMKFWTSLVPYFITIWDGDKSEIGKVTICGYQRNQNIHKYIISENEIIRKNVITLKDYKKYII